jgi:hypothetical protein
LAFGSFSRKKMRYDEMINDLPNLFACRIALGTAFAAAS